MLCHPWYGSNISIKSTCLQSPLLLSPLRCYQAWLCMDMQSSTRRRGKHYIHYTAWTGMAEESWHDQQATQAELYWTGTESAGMIQDDGCLSCSLLSLQEKKNKPTLSVVDHTEILNCSIFSCPQRHFLNYKKIFHATYTILLSLSVLYIKWSIQIRKTRQSNMDQRFNYIYNAAVLYMNHQPVYD